MQTNMPTFENISDCKNYNVSFIRIGSNPDNIKSQYKYIDQCVKNKIKPISFIMKSHLLKPKKFAIEAKNLYEQGAKIIYLVDSIGCLRPENIKNFYYEVKYLEPKIKLGFHGHDNLGLATANSLEAFKLNFDFIDMTLQGVGRSSGNLCTEKFLSIISQKNDIPTNFKKLFQFSFEFIKKTKCENKSDIFDIICGYKKIHSGDVKKISGNLDQTKKINKLLQLNSRKRKMLNIY